MSEDPTRFEKLSRVYGHTTQSVELDTGLFLTPSNLRTNSYEVQVDEEAVDIVDVDGFHSMRQLDEYLRNFEEEPRTDEHGIGVA